MKLLDLFKVHIAKSHAFNLYKLGDTAFVTNGFTNNGIQGFVKPLRGDRVFNFVGICISAFCETTVQNPPFMGRGNGGSGIIVLEPLRKMTIQELYLYAAYFNKCIHWRFSYGRMVSKERIIKLNIPNLSGRINNFQVDEFLPRKQKAFNKGMRPRFDWIPLTKIFELCSGDYHNASKLPDGKIPLVSCGEKNNGVIKFVHVPSNRIYKNTLTIAYNGQPLTAKFHPYQFAAKDDVAVCILKKKLKISTLIFIQVVLNYERWRYSYGRKCFKEKLSQMALLLPVTNQKDIDETIVEKMVENTFYWNFIFNNFQKGVMLRHDIVSI